MPTTYKVLGQSNPTASTDTTLYTVPASTSAVVSTVSVCNRGSAAATYRVAVRPAGASLANQHYVTYDVTLPAYATDTLTLGITLATTDVLTVYASTGDVTFQAFGSELS